jgi:phospholipase/carboxylesterase
MNLSYVEVNPRTSVKAVVIWLHGLGDSGHGFAPIVPQLKLPEALGVRFVFPHAPVRAVTVNNGMKMNAWYDIKSLDLENRADEAGVLESAELLEKLVDDEMARGVPSDKIVLAGFSQGGVIALHVSTRFKHKLAGVLAMSTYMCNPDKLAAEKAETNLQTPFLMAHGSQDQMVPLFVGEQARKTLTECGFSVQWHDYPMEHCVCGEELIEVSDWLQKVLAD